MNIFYSADIDNTPKLQQNIIDTLRTKYNLEYGTDIKYDPNFKCVIVDMKENSFFFYEESISKSAPDYDEVYCKSLEELYLRVGIINHCKIKL